jgi:hypothetical protein
MSISRQQIPNTHQWTTWEEVFSKWSVPQLRDTTIEELLEAVFSCGPQRGVISRTSLRVYLVGRQ